MFRDVYSPRDCKTSAAFFLKAVTLLVCAWSTRYRHPLSQLSLFPYHADQAHISTPAAILDCTTPHRTALTVIPV